MRTDRDSRPFAMSSGQASVEYLLTLACVLLALSGVTGLFARWVAKGLGFFASFLQRTFFQ
jgi:uncharacterized protein (UPF0333 family)